MTHIQGWIIILQLGMVFMASLVYILRGITPK